MKALALIVQLAGQRILTRLYWFDPSWERLR